MTDQTKKEPAGLPVTLKDIALAAGVSHGAVSLALRNSPRIGEATRQRIQALAKEMDYRPNAMAAGLAHFKRATTIKPTHAALAWLNFWPDQKKLRSYKEFDHYWQGAAACAEKFGYRLDEFVCNDPQQVRRLEKILSSRGISGLLVPPGPLGDGWKDFPWERYSVVRLGHSDEELAIHAVTADQVANTLLAYDKIAKKGYERISFVGDLSRARLFGAGFFWAMTSAPTKANKRLPMSPLLLSDIGEKAKAGNERLFLVWLKKMKPDAILCDLPLVPQWLQKAGYRVPEDISLATTSVLDGNIDTGIYQNPDEIGRVSVLMLISLINDNDRGVPSNPREVQIKGRWQDGVSLSRR